ncbi:acyl-CoA N-acyltransferase with RING/FYVE/PHD-type zinc finger protein [Tanacetum coccineum]
MQDQKKKYGKNKAQVVFIGEAPPKKKPGKKIKMVTRKKKDLKKGPKVTPKGKQNRKPRLLARSSNKGSDQEDGDALFSGKRNLISWMLDLGVITPGGKLQNREYKRRKGLPEGTVSHDGIHCNCCNEVMDVSKFVSHGGWKLDEALKNMLPVWTVSVDVSAEIMEERRRVHQTFLLATGIASCNFCGLADSDASQMDDSEDAPNSCKFCVLVLTIFVHLQFTTRAYMLYVRAKMKMQSNMCIG